MLTPVLHLCIVCIVNIHTEWDVPEDMAIPMYYWPGKIRASDNSGRMADTRSPTRSDFSSGKF